MESTEEPVMEEVFKILKEDSLKGSIDRQASSMKEKKMLREGERLPKSLEKKFQPASMACVPMEEIDPAYHQTFVAIGKKGTIHRFSARDSLFILSPLHPLRKLSIYLTTSWEFSAFMVAVVLINVILLATKMDIGFDYACTAIYILEFIMKVLSRGLIVDKFTCLRDPWNWLDVIVILTSVLRPLNLHELNVLQWTRLLKVVPLVQEMKKSFNFMLKCVKQLSEAIFLGMLFVLIFGILGLQVYMGTLTQKCIKNISGNVTDEEWAEHSNNSMNWLPDGHTYKLCGNATSSHPCPEGYTCLQGFGPNPLSGYENFDNIGYAIWASTRSILQDFIDGILPMLVSANGEWHVVYFLLSFFFGTYVVGTLAYAIIGDLVMRQREENAQDISVEDQTESQQLSQRSNEGNKFQKIIKSIINHFAFEFIITGTIILDIILLSIDDHYPDTSTIKHRIYVVTLIVVLFVYFMEFALKICGLGPKAYFKKGWNIFDCVILLDLIASFLAVFSFRFSTIRMFKIVPRWTTLHLIFKIIFDFMKSVWGFIALFFTIWMCFALNEMANFGPDYIKKGDLMPRWNFADLTHSLLTVFRSWAGETIETMWDCVDLSGKTCFVQFPVVLFTGMVMIMIFNVNVICITLKTLQKHKSSKKVSTLTKIGQIICYPFKRICGGGSEKGSSAIIKGKLELDEGLGEDVPINLDLEQGDVEESEYPTKENENKPEKEALHKVQLTSYRNKMHAFIEGRIVKWISILLIVVSSVILTSEMDINNRNYEPAEKNALQAVANYTDLIFTTCFALLLFYKVIASGPINCCKSFGWVFDTLILSEIIVHMACDNLRIPTSAFAHIALPIFLFVRSLRPFMLVSRIETLTVVIDGIWKELRFLTKFIMNGLFIWLFFSVSGSYLFSYSFYHCVDPENGEVIYIGDSKYNLTEDMSSCYAKNLTWVNAEFNFDYAARSFVSWTMVANRNGWINIMYDAFDASGINQNYSKEQHMKHFYVVFAFLVLGVFLTFNILLGVVVSHFKRDKFKGIFFTKDQLTTYEENVSASTATLAIPSPGSGIREKMYNLVNNQWFDVVVMSAIIASTSIYVLDYYNISDSMIYTLDCIKAVITVLYVIEMLLKLVGWGKHYFKSWWNRFDMIVVITALMDLAITDLMAKYFISGGLFWIFRLLRIFQFKPFMSRAKMLGLYFKALSLTKPALFNLIAFQAIFMLSYSNFGMAVFGHLKPSDAWTHGLVNFHEFLPSFTVLFYLSSRSGIDTVLHTITKEDDCDVEDIELHSRGTCGDWKVGYFFIYSYLIGSFLILMNFYLVFILEIFSQIQKNKLPKNMNLELDVVRGIVENDPLQNVEVKNGEQK